MDLSWILRRHTPATPSSSEPLKHGRTFRVRGVPLAWDSDGLKSFLTEHDNTTGPVIKSLADEIGGRSSTATVIFQNVPVPLQTKAWSIRISSTIEAHPARDQYLSLDDDFLGITTLYTPSPDNHKIE
ncbi:hypothetical protein AUP68_11884 [Ilyonectria robusta]